MGNSLDARGKPTFTDTPTQTVTDLQAAADFADKVGGLLKGTAAQRTALTTSAVSTGWLFAETDTGLLYQKVTSGWRRVSRTSIGAKLAGATDVNGAINATNPFAPLVPTWVQVTIGQTSSDALTKVLDVVVWDTPSAAATFQLRFRRTDTNDWAGGQPVVCYVTCGLEPS